MHELTLLPPEASIYRDSSELGPYLAEMLDPLKNADYLLWVYHIDGGTFVLRSGEHFEWYWAEGELTQDEVLEYFRPITQEEFLRTVYED